jgi:hypothetical protein
MRKATSLGGGEIALDLLEEQSRCKVDDSLQHEREANRNGGVSSKPPQFILGQPQPSAPAPLGQKPKWRFLVAMSVFTADSRTVDISV